MLHFAVHCLADDGEIREDKPMEDVHVAALIEDFRGQFKVFGEALQAQRETLQAQNDKLDQLDTKVDSIAANVAVLKVDVAVLKDDMADVKARLTHVERGVNGKTRRKTTKR
jgi:hypothetical protein